MFFSDTLTELDQRLQATLDDFLPRRIYDFHLHFYRLEHYTAASRKQSWPDRLDAADWREALCRHSVFRERTVAGLAFGVVSPDSINPLINDYIREQVDRLDDPWSRCLYIVAPGDDRAKAAEALRSGRYRGFKVYHCYADRPDTMNATLAEYAPDWMWELLDETGGILLLHMVLPHAIADGRNQRDILRLCQKYPRMQLVMAHAARCFSHRHSLAGLETVAHLPNVWIDTSAVCEAESFANALRVLGPHRVLYGSDYPVSEMRGRCMSVGEGFYWHHPIPALAAEAPKMTLVGIESLLALREALEGFGATRQDIDDVFWNNAMRCLNLADAEALPAPSGDEAWREAREVISCGTGLLSKRAESFLTPQWPTYFTKASGCRVWDRHGKMYRDFVGGVGAVVLGYGDPDVTRAVTRRMTQGNYSSLLAMEEVELARRLLALHPGMGRVRYARGGGEAMAVAVRIARAATGKSGIAFCGYHGWHDWYLAANVGHPEDALPVPGLNPLGVPPELAGTAQPFLFNQIASLHAACERLGENLAAVVMEPLRGNPPTPEFLEAVHAVTKARGAVLVIDEVTSGMRYGYPGVAPSLGYEADLLVYAKAMSNGVPFGVVVGKGEVMERAEPSFISSSYWTDGLGAAAALAVLDKMEREAVQPALWRKGERFSQEVRAVLQRYPSLHGSLTGMPVSSLLAWDMGTLTPALKARVIEEMLRRGFLLGTILYLMHAHREEDLAAFLVALDESLAIVAEDLDRGALESVKTTRAVTIGRLT